MATLTKITRFRRKLRRAKMGRERKRRARNHGTTPPFEIHTPDAVANAARQREATEEASSEE